MAGCCDWGVGTDNDDDDDDDDNFSDVLITHLIKVFTDASLTWQNVIPRGHR